MGKLSRYVIVMSGLMLLFYFTGLISDTPNSILLNLLLSPENMDASSFATKVILILQVVGIAGAVILGFASSNIELAAMSPFVVYLFNLLWDFLAVFNKVASVNEPLAVLMFSPFLILYMITIIEFWRGRSD